ncbi:MAG: hypothetical protein J6A92_05580 [Lachnospiraceae bacterium]|nr:hypothetical protein [Lachnospiraceae bacterium]
MKKIFIGIVTVVVLGIIFYAWDTTRDIQVFQEMKASDFSKIEIWSGDTLAEITEEKDIQRFIDILQSTHIHKRKSPDRAGGWILADLYYKSGEQQVMSIAVDQINVGDGEYKSEKNIYDEISKLYEEFAAGNPYKGCILTIEELERVTDIYFYVSDKKQRVLSEKDKSAILVEIMNIKLTEEDKIPEDEWIEGGVMVTLALEDGETIEFACDDNFVAFGEQYFVQNKVASMLMEVESE